MKTSLLFQNTLEVETYPIKNSLEHSPYKKICQ